MATRGGSKALAPLADPLRRAALPTAQAIKGKASQAYDALARSNVAIPGPAMSDAVDRVLSRLNAPDIGLDKAIHPATSRVTQTLEQMRKGAEMSELQNILKRLKRVGGQHGEDAHAAGIAQREIRATLAKMAPEADALLRQADGLYNQGMNASRVDKAIERAITQANGSGSGGNTNNAIRSAMGRLAEGKNGKYFPADTRAAMLEVKKGTRGGNAARMIGQAFDPTGGGLRGMLNTAGMFASGGTTIPLALGGYASRRTGERGTLEAARDISRRIRAQGLDIPESQIHQMLQDPQQAQMLARMLGAQRQPVASQQPAPQQAGY